MIHYTFNTGHWVNSPRSGVFQPTLDALKSLAITGTHPLPVMEDLEVKVNIREHSAGFSVRTKRVPSVMVITAGLAWTPESQQLIRQRLGKINAVTGYLIVPERPFPEPPSTVPWLGTVLHPGVVLLGERIALIGDFERCLAWAILESVGRV